LAKKCEQVIEMTNFLLEKYQKCYKKYSSDEGSNLLDLDRVARVARKTIKELETENIILQNRERPNVLHNLEDSEMRE